MTRILLIKLSSIGDVAHTVPASWALARRFPQARIDWLVAPAATSIVRSLPWIREAIALPEPAKWPALARSLRGNGYDLAIDVQGLLRSSLWTVASSARSRIGRGRWPWLDVSVSMYETGATPHAIENTARALTPLGVDPATVWSEFRSGGSQSLSASLRERGEAILRSLDLRRPYWAWIPQASWPSKRLPIFDPGSPPANGGRLHVLLGEEPRNGRNSPEGWLDLAGKLPLLDSVALALHAEKVIAADTGPAHLAAILGASIVGCYGPTFVERTGLRGPRAQSVRGSCSPCLRRRCRAAGVCMGDAVTAAVRVAAEAGLP